MDLLPVKKVMSSQPSLTQLKKELEERQRAIRDLAQKRADLLVQLDGVDTEIEKLSGTSVQEAIETLDEGEGSGVDERQLMLKEAIAEIKAEEEAKKKPRPGTLTEHIVKILAENRGGLKAREIADLVVDRGYKSSAINLINNVNAALNKIRNRGEIKFDRKTKMYYPRK